MIWRRKFYDLSHDPYGTSSKPGILHEIRLTDAAPGLKDFEFSTYMYIPTDMPEVDRKLNLQLFADTADTQLREKHSEWQGRDSLALFKA